MTDVFYVAATVLLATVGLALARAVRGPGPVDRIMAAQLTGTGVIGIALLLGAARRDASMLDAALVATLLAAVAVVAYVGSRRSTGASRDRSDEESA